MAAQPVVFFIGCNAVSNPVPLPQNQGEWAQCIHSFLSSPPVDRCVLKPEVCDGASEFMGVVGRQPIPQDVLQASALAEDDINGVIRDVSECITGRASCCWKFGYLGPLCCVIGWLDISLAQCSCGIVRCCCAEPAIAEVKEIVERHNQALAQKGCMMSVAESELEIFMAGSCRTLYYPAFLIQAVCNPHARQPSHAYQHQPQHSMR